MRSPKQPFSDEPPEGDGGRRRYLWAALGTALLYWAWRRWRSGGDETAPLDPEATARGHRPASDASASGVALFGGGLLLVLALTLAGVWILVGLFDGAGRAAPERTFETFAGELQRPALRSDPAAELMEVRRREDSLLSGYAWVDREAGTVRIPIERAMEMYASRSPGAEAPPDTLHLLTESGFGEGAAPLPSPPPYVGLSPEGPAADAEISGLLERYRTDDGDTLTHLSETNR